MRGTIIGVLLVVVLAGITVYSAVHGALIGVILAAPPALLFTAAIVDNRYVYRRPTEASTPAEGTAPVERTD